MDWFMASNKLFNEITVNLDFCFNISMIFHWTKNPRWSIIKIFDEFLGVGFAWYILKCPSWPLNKKWARMDSNHRTSRMWTVRSNQLSYAPVTSLKLYNNISSNGWIKTKWIRKSGIYSEARTGEPLGTTPEGGTDANRALWPAELRALGVLTIPRHPEKLNCSLETNLVANCGAIGGDHDIKQSVVLPKLRVVGTREWRVLHFSQKCQKMSKSVKLNQHGRTVADGQGKPYLISVVICFLSVCIWG